MPAADAHLDVAAELGRAASRDRDQCGSLLSRQRTSCRQLITEGTDDVAELRPSRPPAVPAVRGHGLEPRTVEKVKRRPDDRHAGLA